MRLIIIEVAGFIVGYFLQQAVKRAGEMFFGQ